MTAIRLFFSMSLVVMSAMADDHLQMDDASAFFQLVDRPDPEDAQNLELSASNIQKSDYFDKLAEDAEILANLKSIAEIAATCAKIGHKRNPEEDVAVAVTDKSTDVAVAVSDKPTDVDVAVTDKPSHSTEAAKEALRNMLTMMKSMPLKSMINVMGTMIPDDAKDEVMAKMSQTADIFDGAEFEKMTDDLLEQADVILDEPGMVKLMDNLSKTSKTLMTTINIKKRGKLMQRITILMGKITEKMAPFMQQVVSELVAPTVRKIVDIGDAKYTSPDVPETK